MSRRGGTQRMEALAEIYDAEILPVWSEPFGRMLLRDLELESCQQVLDVACGTGFPATEIVSRLPKHARLIAIDNSSAMLNVARQKMSKVDRGGVYFKTEYSLPKLSFADDVYDLVLCNLGLVDFPDPKQALIDFARVTKPGGEIRCSLPMQGTFSEFYEIFEEVLVQSKNHEALNRLRHHLRENYPSEKLCRTWMDAAAIEHGPIATEKFTLAFHSARDFFYSPTIEYGPLSLWKAIAGTGQAMQDVFWQMKEIIDARCKLGPFGLSVFGGVLRGRVVEPLDLSDEVREDARMVADASTIENMRPVMLSAGDDIDALTQGVERPSHLSEGTSPAFLSDSRGLKETQSVAHEDRATEPKV